MQTIPRVPAPLGAVFAMAYGAVVRSRNALYDSGAFRQRRLQSPVISIGNITTGGSGKTPLVIYTARKLSELDRVPVVLTRGYGRNNPGESVFVAPDASLHGSMETIGDEPELIRRKLPEIWLGLSKNRYSAGSLLEKQLSATAFILDDGFQHRSLFRNLDIVVIDALQSLLSNRLVPRGSFREPITGLRRCDAVVINGTDAPAVDIIRSEIGALDLRAEIFRCNQFIKKLVPFELWKQGLEHAQQSVADKPSIGSVYLVAALGNPLRFQTDVLKLGLRVSGSRFYRDHYRLRPNDWNACIQAARHAEADAILISEKDAVKIADPPDGSLLVAVQDTLMENEKAYVELLNRVLEND